MLPGVAPSSVLRPVLLAPDCRRDHGQRPDLVSEVHRWLAGTTLAPELLEQLLTFPPFSLSRRTEGWIRDERPCQGEEGFGPGLEWQHLRETRSKRGAKRSATHLQVTISASMSRASHRASLNVPICLWAARSVSTCYDSGRELGVPLALRKPVVVAA
jgi:hypothetical protein